VVIKEDDKNLKQLALGFNKEGDMSGDAEALADAMHEMYGSDAQQEARD